MSITLISPLPYLERFFASSEGYPCQTRVSPGGLGMALCKKLHDHTIRHKLFSMTGGFNGYHLKQLCKKEGIRLRYCQSLSMETPEKYAVASETYFLGLPSQNHLDDFLSVISHHTPPSLTILLGPYCPHATFKKWLPTLHQTLANLPTPLWVIPESWLDPTPILGAILDFRKGNIHVPECFQLPR